MMESEDVSTPLVKGLRNGDVPQPLPRMHRYRALLLTFMCAQILLGAGVVYGWPALETTLVDLGVYASECAPVHPSVQLKDTTACHAQLLKLNSIYVAASWGCQATGVLGFVLDRIGVKYTMVGSSLALALGAALFGLSSGDGGSGAPAMMNAFLPGLTIMGFAGGGIYLAAQGLANLFPESSRRVALFLITGVFAPSMLVFLLFHLLVIQWNVATLRVLFLGYAIGQVVLAAVSAVVWPHEFQHIEDVLGSQEPVVLDLESPLSGDGEPSLRDDTGHSNPQVPPPAQTGALRSLPDENEGFASGSSGAYGSLRAAGAAPSTAHDSSAAVVPHPPPLPVSPSRKRFTQTFVQQLLDARFLAQVAMFSIMLLPAQFYIGNLPSQVGRYTNDHHVISEYARYFNLVYSFVSFATPVLGWVADRAGFGATYFIVTALYLGAFAAISWAPSLPFLFVSFVLYTFARNGQFSLFVSYLAASFGPAHLGKLIGIGFLCSAMVSLAQAPLLHFVLETMDGNFVYANVAFMAALGLMTPYGFWLVCRRPTST